MTDTLQKKLQTVKSLTQTTEKNAYCSFNKTIIKRTLKKVFSLKMCGNIIVFVLPITTLHFSKVRIWRCIPYGHHHGEYLIVFLIGSLKI